MYLKSLELSGFKSFAKKASLSFTSPITGIVGPNGSGKSNVAEAFRFVLGEQSIKSLRGKRGEDMIWNGGLGTSSGMGGFGGGARANRASVKVVFDNTSKLFPSIDFDEVSLERVVHRDNTNEYLLNGTQVRLKDIAELLASAHIGATGHHIISQGEADRILSASIRERREMIEDALGLKMYQWKKLESIRKLERTDENMKQVESLRREIAPHVKLLKKQVEKVLRAEELRKELVMMYKEYFAVEDHYLKSERLRLNSAITGPKKELAELDRNLERAKKILTDSKNRDKRSDGIMLLEGKLSHVRSEKDSITRESGRLQGEINANKRVVAKEMEKQRQDQLKTVYLKDVQELVVRIENLGTLTDVRKLYSEVVATLKAFVERHRGVNDSILIVEAEKEVVSLTHELAKQEQKLAALIGVETKLVREYNELKENIEKEKDTDREAEKDVFKIIARQNEVRHIVGELGSALAKLDHEEEAFNMELTQAGIIAGREAVDFAVVVPAKAGIQDQKMNSVFSGMTLDPRLRGDDTRNRGEDLTQGQEETRNVQEQRRHAIEKNKIRLEDSGGIGGAEVMKEYKETEERDAFLAKELVDLEKAKVELLSLIAELDARIDYEFKNGILKINAEFQKYFDLMFGGGHAELSVVKEPVRKKRGDLEDLSDLLVDSEGAVGRGQGAYEVTTAPSTLHPTPSLGTEGLEVNVSLPRKKVKGLMMLSGGERALTSIALLFAVSQVNPPPFIILDETDAALDEANSRKYSEMIRNLSKQSQLILITHNRETMSCSGVLYGVTMGNDGASRLLSIAFEEAVAVAK